MEGNEKLTYASAGVNIEAGNKAVELIRKSVKSTFRSGVLTDIGGFGGLFALDPSRYLEPVLVSGTDGVGTKLRVAIMMNRHHTIGIDAVAMCANDVLVQGAEPLFFLDYLAVGRLLPEKAAMIVEGVAEGCRRAGCALIGGETAEMPGFYGEDEYDIAGFVVGVVDKSKIIDGSAIRPGDVMLGITSSGLHSNGFSLVRKTLFEIAGYGVETHIEELGRTLGEELLEPTRIYVRQVLPLLNRYCIKGMAHITGGGLTENIPRVLPDGTAVVIDRKSWQVPQIFNIIQRLGRIDHGEMLKTFNMGIGLVMFVSGEQAGGVIEYIRAQGGEALVMGEVVASPDKCVTYK
ncbi:MAG: phosphoribosylaminoimidazole synthetase [Peptococcaceae bacterium BRH_c4a]|nr:MAG: phosphoribosylaminoimidazole synthetase [Peptococcaceae bacterium BRH_c4a]